MRYVIAGLHAAGRSACAWLRRLDPGAEILGLDPEAAPAYARPLISHVLAGEIEPGLLDLAEADPFAALGVTVVPERAVALAPDRREITTESGRTLAYDRLLLATGASPRKVEMTGGGRPGAHPVVRPAGWPGRSAISGAGRTSPGSRTASNPGAWPWSWAAGLVGFKLTVGLLARRMRVRLIVSSPPAPGPERGRVPGRDHRTEPGRAAGRGAVHQHLGHGRGAGPGAPLPAGFEHRGRGGGGPGGGRKRGVVPAVGWLAGTGLDDREGIPVDERLKTAAPDVYAAGDLARAYDVALGAPQVNAIWPLAVEQGRIAAWNMAGKDAPYPGGLAMNSIPMFGGHLVSVGAVNPRYTAGCEGLALEPRKGSYLKLVFRENTLVGAVGFNAAPRLGELAWAVRQGLTRERIPRAWLTNTVNAAPLAAATWGLAQNG